MSGRRSISNTFTVTTMDEPIAGPRGKTGRFYYYAQEWTNSSSPLYIVTDAQAPYFLYNNNYWVFNPEENYPNGISMSAMGTPSSNNSKWQLMTNDFKYIITQAIFGKYAHFGSAIINEDWLISMHGTIDGVSYGGSSDNPDKYQGQPAYTYFDPNGFPYINRNQWTIGGSESTCEHAGFELTLTRGSSYTFNITGSIASGSWTMSVGLKNVATGNIISLTSFNSTTQTTKTVTVTISSGATGSSVWRLYQSRSGGSSNGYVTRFESNGSHSFIPNYAIDLRTGASYQFRAHIRGTVYAEAGEIGGFIIDPDRLYNSNWDAGIDINYDSKAVKIGKNAQGASFAEDAIIRAENTKVLGGSHNTALYLNASGATYNYAFYGNGNGVLNGLMFGYKTTYFEVSNTDGTVGELNLMSGATFIISGAGGNHNAYPPQLSKVRLCLGLPSSSTTPFSIEIEVINETTGSVLLYFRGYTGIGSDYPYLMSPNGNTESGGNAMIELTKGAYLKLRLTYTALGYRAHRLVYNHD